MLLELKATALRGKGGEDIKDSDGNISYLQHDAWSLMMLFRSIDGLTQAPHMRVVMKLHDLFMEAWVADAVSVELDEESVTTMKTLLADPKDKFREGSTLLSDFTVQRTLLGVRDALGI